MGGSTEHGCFFPSLVVLNIFILVSKNRRQWQLHCIDKLTKRRNHFSFVTHSSQASTWNEVTL